MSLGKRAFLGTAAAVLAWPCVGMAQAWPEKPIRYIVPYAAGGVTDELARIVTNGLHLGQPVIVDNKPGQGGGIGMAELARSASDGYTIGGGTLGTHVLNPALYPKLAYDPQKSFVPVILLAKQPNILLVNPSLGVNTVQELISLLKAHPGKYSFGSSGNGSSQHIAGEMFKRAAAVNVQHVPYKGSGQILTDLLGNHIHMAIDNISAGLPMVRSGKLKALAVTSLKRSPAAPDLPTLDESGLANFEMVPWHAVFAPAGTPAVVVSRLNQGINAILAQPATRKRLEELGIEDPGGTPEDVGKLLAKDLPRMKEIVVSSGATID
ncbi:Bug family tripartite tricarboxylate transporter substrate binding protein [Acidovorax sp. SDU_ACID1]|uniref:Bug family tripartite tricarboxylate transporter substrate binding protein n=1 Tax=Acidovorax sp. SDU_ACID1 TaxID=3136632 RepID=UPI0038733445